MMQQWHEIRAKLSDDTLLMFRLGDFYEIFLQDAERGAKLLGITLTHRHGMPMAGIPFHAADGYIQKLLDQGIKIAICDQMETPKPGKLVKRELTRIITPGTRMADTQIDAQRNHFLLALTMEKKQLQAAWLDLTTGEFCIASETKPANLFAAFEGLDPARNPRPGKSVAAMGPAAQPREISTSSISTSATAAPSPRSRTTTFDTVSGTQAVMDTLGVLNLEGFGIDKNHPALGAAGAIVHYATETLCAKPENLRQLSEYSSEKNPPPRPRHAAQSRDLQVRRQHPPGLPARRDGRHRHPAGARLLERWLCAPELDLSRNPPPPGLRRRVRRRSRTLDRAPTAPARHPRYRAHPRPPPKPHAQPTRTRRRARHPQRTAQHRATLLEFPGTPVAAIAGRIHNFDTLCEQLANGLADELPGKIDDGGTIRDGYDEQLDHFRSLTRDSQKWLTEFELAEQERTGIKNLRIRFNGASAISSK